MPFFPRIFSNTFRFSLKENKEQQTTVLPKANLNASKRLQQWNSLLNEGADLLDDYLATGGYSLPKTQEFNQKKELARRQPKQGDIKVVKPFLHDTLYKNNAEIFFKAHETLRDPETWDRLYASALNLSHQNQFKRLNQQWLRHAPYSHCSPEGLLKIAQIIEKLYVAIAQLEKDAPRYAIYKKEKLALDLYRKHLQNYKTLLKAQQDYIAEALGAHIIEALKTRDLNAHELLSGLYRELNKEIKGFTPLNSTLPLARAYHYCIKRGNPSLSQSLEKVMHLGQHNLLTVLRQKKEHARS